MKSCTICKNSESKYKCSNCEVPYCSIPCFKTHKETPCERPESTAPKETDAPRTLAFTTIDTVPLAKLEQLRDCEPLKNLLYNPHLRKLLKDLDSSAYPERAIQSAMMEPLFLEFADECLKVIEPDEEAQRDQEELL